jgi:hypothetical protein
VLRASFNKLVHETNVSPRLRLPLCTLSITDGHRNVMLVLTS